MNNYESLIGTLLDNRYRLRGIVGMGGMAVVYEAEDTLMNRTVAIKMLKSDAKEDEQAVKRFVNESKAVAMLSHQNIVNIFDVSVSGDNQFIVMEYVDGITLKDYIKGKGRLNWREAAVYAEQILKALAHAHEKGVIHRDIKPQNIILLRNGLIKVADFGIAKLPGSEQLTMTDKAIGTVHYISPEQASGAAEILNTSDIYSVGVILYEMTTGRLPFEGDTAIKIAMKQINEPPINPRNINPDIPKGLAQIILRAMSKKPADRYRTASEMVKHLTVLKNNPATVFSSSLPVPVGAGPQSSGSGSSAQNGGQSQKNGKAVTNAKSAAVKTKKKPSPSRRRAGNPMLPIISGVTVAFLIILAISIINIVIEIIDSQTKEPTINIKIPNYIGELYTDELARSIAEKDQLRLTQVKYEWSDKYEKDIITTQDPAPLSPRKRDSQLILTVSKGREVIVMPDVTVVEWREAERDLKRLGLEVKVERLTDDVTLENYVIRTNPVADTELSRGDTVFIFVSQGQTIKVVHMPDLVGKSEAEAIKVLYADEIRVDKVNYAYSDKPAGTVIWQSVTPTLSVRQKSTKVSFTVSLGPEFPVLPPDPTDPVDPGDPGVMTTEPHGG